MKTILIIEDNLSILENLTEFFSMEGFKALNAMDGSNGLRIAAEQQPDLIICDVLMKGMNGHEVLHALIKNPITISIPFIFSTSLSEKADEAESLAMGADAYITKPFELENLLLIVNRLIEQGSKRKQSTAV